MTPVRIYDFVAALFCVIWFVVFSYQALDIGRYSYVVELAIGAGLAFWGRRSRIWASAIGGGISLATPIGISQHAFRQYKEAQNNGHWISDNPVADGKELLIYMLIGAIVGGIVCVLGKQLTLRTKVLRENSE
jgi:hypothetical protein